METKIEFPMMPVSLKSSDEEDENGESCLNGLFPTDMELAQFTADVETLLGGGIEQEFHVIEEVGLSEMLKMEKEEEEEEEEVATREVCDLDNYYEYSNKRTFDEEEDENDDVVKNTIGRIKEESKNKEKAFMLRLDYESVISNWGDQRTLWTVQEPHTIDLNMVCCLDSKGESGGDDHVHHQNYFRGLRYMEAEGRREDRVSRYREKRRKRLYSKKIRYEVRKLNAEKRPRMKGRFVKRSSISTAAH